MFYRFSALACANVSKSGEMFTLVGLSRRHLGKPELRKVERKLVMHGYNIFRGVDLNKNGNFKEEKLIMYGYKKCMGRS